MESTKHVIKNRNGLRIALTLYEPADPIGVAIITHGLGGSQSQDQIKMFAQACYNSGYIAITYDSTHSIGESDGEYVDATMTSHIRDLEDVIDRYETQHYRYNKIVLLGHSLGGYASLYYASHNPTKILGLAPLSTVVDGRLTEQTLVDTTLMKQRKETGFLIQESKSQPGLIKRLSYGFIEDMTKFSLPAIEHIQCPVLLIVGSEDTVTPACQQEMLFDKLSLNIDKQYYILPECGHNYRKKEHVDHIYTYITERLHTLS